MCVCRVCVGVCFAVQVNDNLYLHFVACVTHPCRGYVLLSEAAAKGNKKALAELAYAYLVCWYTFL